MKAMALAVVLGFFVGACELVAPINDDAAGCPCGDGFECCRNICLPDGQLCGATIGAQHASCNSPIAVVVPAEPAINVDAAGRPLFDYWRDVPSSSTNAWQCNPSLGVWCNRGITNTDGCMVFADDGEGFCANADGDIWCDGEGEIMTWDNGCWACVKVEAHASLCARGVEGIDCRAWPFPGDGARFTACVTHGDCEDGLICGPAAGGGFALCQCPEEFGTNLFSDASCELEFRMP